MVGTEMGLLDNAADCLEKDKQAYEKVKLADAVEAGKVINPTEKVSADADESNNLEIAAIAPVAVETKAISVKEIAVIVEGHNAQESDAAKAEGPILKDMFCPDDGLDILESKETRSVETQTFESGIAQLTTSTFSKEFESKT